MAENDKSTKTGEEGSSQSGQVEHVIQAAVQNLTPLASTIETTIYNIVPTVEKYLNLIDSNWHHVTPYHPEKLFTIVVGLVLIFFGGSYMTLIGAIEAFRLTGWETTKSSLNLLYQNYKVAEDASKKDDLLDEDNDGVADVKQIERNALYRRKFMVVIKSIDVDQVQNACYTMYMSFMAVIATLRFHFAESVTYGTCLGEIMNKSLNPILQPILLKLLPQAAHKFIPMIILSSCKAVAVSFAWFAFRVVAAFYSSVRGAVLVAEGVMWYAKEWKYITNPTEDVHMLLHGIALFLAISGATWQFRNDFRIPFPINILMMPLTIANDLLSVYVISMA